MQLSHRGALRQINYQLVSDSKYWFEVDPLLDSIRHGALGSRTAIRLVQQWIALHFDELHAEWELAQNGRELKSISRPE